MKSLLWVEDSLIKELQMLDEAQEISQDSIKSIITKFNNEIDMLSENIDSNVLEMRAKAQKAKEAYSKTVEEECAAIDEMWEKLDEVRHEARKKFNVTINELDTIKSKISEVNKSIDSIFTSSYKIEKTLELVHTIANMSDRDRELVEKLIKVSQ